MKNLNKWVNQQTLNQINEFGTKFYSFVENTLGLSEDSEYQPNFDYNENGLFTSGPKCPDCVYSNDVRSDIINLLHVGFRTCGM